MFKKICFAAFLLLVSAAVYASGHKDMAACLADKIGNFKSSKDIIVTNHQGDILSVSRGYQYKGNSVTVSIWKIPGNKQLWPYIGGKSKAKLMIVAGRMCILNVDEKSKISTLVINIDMGYISPPPYLYRVSVSAGGPDGGKVVQTIGKNLNYDKLFALYGK